MEFGIPYETYFCICETEFMGQKCRPGDRIRWDYADVIRGVTRPTEEGIWAKVYFAPWKDAVGQAKQADLEWQFIGDVAQDHLAVSLPDGAEPHQLFDIVDLGLYRGMEPFLSFCGNEYMATIDAEEHLWSIYWSGPSEDEHTGMLLNPFRAIHADGKDDETPKIISLYSPATGMKRDDNLYALLGMDGDKGGFYDEYFFYNSVEIIQWAEDVKFKPGSLVNLGLAAYLEFQRVRKQAQPGLRFADFLLHKDRIFRNCFCLDEVLATASSNQGQTDSEPEAIPTRRELQLLEELKCRTLIEEERNEQMLEAYRQQWRQERMDADKGENKQERMAALIDAKNKAGEIQKQKRNLMNDVLHENGFDPETYLDKDKERFVRWFDGQVLEGRHHGSENSAVEAIAKNLKISNDQARRLCIVRAQYCEDIHIRPWERGRGGRPIARS